MNIISNGEITKTKAKKEIVMKKVLLTAALVLVASNAFALLSGSKHDLSSGNTSNASRGTSDQLCKYCHVPHNAIIPAALWARQASVAVSPAVYTNAGSMNAVPVAPTATQSTACLSCHNATPSNGIDASTNLSSGIVTATKIIGEAVTGLSNDHPIAFTYNAALVIADTATGGGQVGLQTPAGNTVNNGSGSGLPLYGAGTTLECATCHAVHGIGTLPMFLRTTAAGSKICLKCHIK